MKVAFGDCQAYFLLVFFRKSMSRFLCQNVLVGAGWSDLRLAVA
ncbi:hypothetical protein NC99_16980 [Sunxiuqinia dokdonensis]|uniref:Uncharacterized protein n=1 Tax=Sunxiuqinia dokdonensis TaxID=1409788 RepID=A0A0L8VAV3_9BACT|nr:hypothetical protein NC99_16980 [Sunxiuqinia dokdonensis]